MMGNFCNFLYRALEDKKEAFAKAEIERRKEALELRRKCQKEATMRFKSVFKRPPIKPPQSRKLQDSKGTHLCIVLIICICDHIWVLVIAQY